MVEADLHLVKPASGPTGNTSRTPLPSFPQAPGGAQTAAPSKEVLFGTTPNELVQGTARAEALTEFASSPFEHKGVCDVYVDDGQVLVRPAGLLASRPRHCPSLLWRDPLAPQSKSMLRAQHASCAHPSGITSSRRLGHCPRAPHRASAQPDDNTSALGPPFGSLHNINAQMRQAVESGSELRQAILSVDHAPTEVVLTKQCANVSKLTTCASTETEWTSHCWPLLTPNFAPPSARPWLETCWTTVGGRPPLACSSVDLASAQHRPWLCLHSLRAHPL